MTNKEKQLLLKDLCARLPYGVIVQDRNGTHVLTPGNTELGTEYIKPYLRPISSMTEKETNEWHKITLGQRWVTFNNVERCADWLNAHHIDYRGLIPMGLALEAPKDMYKIE